MKKKTEKKKERKEESKKRKKDRDEERKKEKKKERKKEMLHSHDVVVLGLADAHVRVDHHGLRDGLRAREQLPRLVPERARDLQLPRLKIVRK